MNINFPKAEQQKRGVLLKAFDYAHQLPLYHWIGLFQILDTIDGWFLDCQTPLAYSLTANLPPNSTLIEIGSYKGKSTCCFLFSNPTLKVEAIDIFTGSEEHQEILKGKSTLEDFKKNLSSKNFLNRVNINIGKSEDLFNNFKNESIEALFIDGAHDYENVKKDIINYLPKLRRGGLIFGHDYSEDEATDFQGLKQAIDEEIKSKPNNFIDFGYFYGLWAAIKA